MFSNQNTKRESEYGVRSGLQPTGILKRRLLHSLRLRAVLNPTAVTYSRQSAAQTVQCCPAAVNPYFLAYTTVEARLDNNRV